MSDIIWKFTEKQKRQTGEQGTDSRRTGLGGLGGQSLGRRQRAPTAGRALTPVSSTAVLWAHNWSHHNGQNRTVSVSY